MHATFDAVRRIDPTQTGDIRARFQRDLGRRWLLLRRLTTEGINGTEALIGGGPVTVSSISSSVDPVRTFQAWFDAALLRVVLGGDGGWTESYLAEAAARARSRAHRLLLGRVGVPNPTPPDSGKLVTAGAVVELQGLAEAVSQRVVREVQAGLLSQRRPREIARAASQLIGTVGVNRGKALVEFSVNQAFNSASLDAFEAHGLTRVGIEPEHEIVQIGRDYDPDQPRAPAGSSEGGQWVEGGGGGGVGSERPVLGKNVYHGTSESAWSSIKEEGLRSSKGGGGADRIHESKYGKAALVKMRAGRTEHAVFVTRARDVAESYAEQVAKDTGSKPMVLLIRVPAEEYRARFRSDKQSDPWMKALRTEGDIPAWWIKKRYIKDESEREVFLVVFPWGPRGIDALFDAGKKTGPGSRLKGRTPSRSTLYRIRKAERELEKTKVVEVLTAGDDRVCEKCEDIARDGPYNINTARGLIPAHPNAVLEGTTIASYGAMHEMVRARFAGPAVYLRTSTKVFPIGPNHPMLTRRGWRKAHEIEEGDELLHDAQCEGPSIARGSSDLEQMPAVQNVFEAACMVSPRLTTAAAHDFHGDRIFCEGEVDVVRPARRLLPILDPGGIEHFRKQGFIWPDMQSMLEASLSAGVTNLKTVFTTATCLMRCRNLSLTLPLRHALPFDRFLLAGAAAGYIRASEYAVDDGSAGVEALGESKDGGSGSIGAHDDSFWWDRVLSVHVAWFSGWAFDASTATGLYNNCGYVVKNCRCAFVPYFDQRFAEQEIPR